MTCLPRLPAAIALAAAVATMAIGPALARVRTEGLAMPEALQGLPAAGSQCGLTPAEKLQAQQAAALPAPDARCLLSVSELARDKALAEWTWVDVRRPDLAEADAMPGALRLAPELLRTKSFLKTRRVLWVGDGRGQASLLSHCRRLHDEGFTQLRVLHGGWPQWAYHQAQALPSPAMRAADRAPEPLSAAALWAESLYEGNVVVGARADGLVARLPFGLTVEAWSVPQVLQLIERRRKDSPRQSLASVVLAHAPERSAELPLAALRQALYPIPLLVYVGDAAALRTQLAQMEAGWQARERGPKQPRCGQ